MIVGLTLNNNPTVQDVWNTTPAWGVPYSGSNDVAPGAITSTKIDSGAGGFGQSVGGLGVYMWLDDQLLRRRLRTTPRQFGAVLILSTAHRATWFPDQSPYCSAWPTSNAGTANFLVRRCLRPEREAFIPGSAHGTGGRHR